MLKIIERVGAGLALVGSVVWFLWPGENWSPDPEPMVAILVSAFTWLLIEVSTETSTGKKSSRIATLPDDQAKLGFAILVGSHHDDGDNLWEASGLVGTGDAIAAGKVHGYLQGLGAENCEIVSAHNYPGTKLGKNLILVGGPDANSVTKKVMEKLSTRLQLGDPSQHTVSVIDSATGEVFNPTLSPAGEVTSDHGLVLRTANPFNPKAFVLVLAGSFGQGTLAAALFVDQEDILSQKTFGSFKAFEALVKSDVIDQWPQAPKLLQVHELSK